MNSIQLKLLWRWYPEQSVYSKFCSFVTQVIVLCDCKSLSSVFTFLVSIKTVIAVHLQGPHTAPCLGQVIQLNCSHPFNDGSLFVSLERNGTRTVIQGKLEIEQTYIIANVPMTRDTFNNKVWIYRCYTQHLDTAVKDYSNEVVVDAVGE